MTTTTATTMTTAPKAITRHNFQGNGSSTKHSSNNKKKAKLYYVQGVMALGIVCLLVVMMYTQSRSSHLLLRNAQQQRQIQEKHVQLRHQLTRSSTTKSRRSRRTKAQLPLGQPVSSEQQEQQHQQINQLRRDHNHDHRHDHHPSRKDLVFPRKNDHVHQDQNLICQGHRRFHKGTATNQAKVPWKTQQKFVHQGLYENISKGSGVIHAAGVFLQTVSRLQHDQLGLFGTVGEIGVHHGRFTSFLFLTARATEPLLAVDLFDALQDQNVDMSGMGDYKKFVQGMEWYGLTESDVQIITSSSMDLNVEGQAWLSPDAPGFRLLSVDGGHTTELTRHDLNLAFCNLLPGGIVVLDDWYNAAWPGVVEGFFEFVNLDSHLVGATSTPPRYPSRQISTMNRRRRLASKEEDSEPEQEKQKDGKDTETAKLQQLVYPFLVCEGKLYVTNTKEAHTLYLKTILEDSVLKKWVSVYAKVGKQRKRSWPNLMVHNTPYARCTSRGELPKSDIIQSVWLERLETLEQEQQYRQQ